MGLDHEEWLGFRSYTETNEGPITPGQDPRAFEGYMLVHDAGDWSQVHVSNTTYLMSPEGEKVHEWANPEGYIP